MSNVKEDVRWIIGFADHCSKKWWFPLFMSIATQLILILWTIDWDVPIYSFSISTGCLGIVLSILFGWAASRFFRENISEDVHLRVMKDLVEILSEEEYKKIAKALFKKDLERKQR